MFTERDNLFSSEIRPDIDIEGTILALIAMLRGAGLHMIIRSPAPDRTARMRDTILASIQRSLAARALPAHSIYFGALTCVRGCGIHA